jgi:hypothetical protein
VLSAAADRIIDHAPERCPDCQAALASLVVPGVV